ncbi:ABC transporter, ATP-binding protein [Ancylostoma caninum]|uniref:ABC transporter, ATP-binding protein n=1 Tax=Ancylostoma caninum TaxID=29170 RepID=A0A368F849_ANCCA|nr:ABC transporter, ATP-binding protein [Ancylostoma caninum]
MRRINYDDGIDLNENDDEEGSANLLTTENLSYSTPGDPDQLVTDLSLKVPKNKTLLITGTSGVGKTSFVRVIRKLWKPSAGTIVRNFNPRNAMFVPQRPYLPPGQLSLRQQIVFPQIDCGHDTGDIDNNKIVTILEALRLRTLISMCGGLTDPSNFEWQDTLSPGEQQRLSMARVLYHNPSYVFLDEATSSLSVDAEANVYDLLKRYGITYVSTGHRPTLRSFHDMELRLQGKNEWRLLEDSEEDKQKL